MFRIGIIGCGRMAAKMIGSIKDLEEVFAIAKNNLNPFFSGTYASEKTLLALQVCERLPQASARSRVQILISKGIKPLLMTLA